ncbi:MAG: Flp pilus assembly protein CpaB [Gaiellaceae bacterium]
MTYRVRNLAVAIGLTLVAMLLTLFYVTNYKRSVQQGEAQVQVYVSAGDVEQGTAGADLAGALETARVPRRSVVPGAISSPDQIRGLVVAAPLFAGEQVSLRRFSDPAAQGIRAQLKGTMRAVQVPGDANQLLAGTLHAGDRVDLVASLRVDPEQTEHAVRIVLRDVAVLAASSEGASRVPSGTPASVILAVTDTQVQRLFYVLKNADWTLQLRPVVDAADSAERVDSLTTVLNGGRR